MAARSVLVRFHRGLVLSRLRPHPCVASALQLPSVTARKLSDFGGSKPDAATDLSTSTKTSASQETKTTKQDIDPSQFTVRIEVKMPAMGNGGGKVLNWYKQPGDIVTREDVLCDIETADFTFGMETDDENIAIMGEILVKAPSENVKDGEVLCILMHEETDKKKGAPKTSKNE